MYAEKFYFFHILKKNSHKEVSMNKKKNYATKVIAILLTCFLLITSIGIENVSAFWNQAAKNDDKVGATITIQLIHCYHNDTSDPLYSTHYDSSGQHKMDAVQSDLDSWKSDSKNNPGGKTQCVRPTRFSLVSTMIPPPVPHSSTPTSTSMNTRCPMTRASRLITLSSHSRRLHTTVTVSVPDTRGLEKTMSGCTG